ncbi:hypothetical protein H0H93_011820 [Arthromyces matolae]|nr:hypothetical protein H0H93_011820 [Arthromyces matolae]
MSVPNPQQQLRQRKNERFVTDPITHLPLLVHDHQDDDIDTVSIHPAKSNDIHSPEFYVTHPVNNDDLKSTVLERVVNEELQRGRWRVQGESEITSRTKVHAALIALGLIGFGGPLGLVWLWVLSWMLGRSKFGFVELVLGIWGSLGLALVVAVCLVFVPFELVWRFCDEQVVWMLEKLLTQPNANAFKTEPSTSTNASNIPNTPPRPVPIPNPESALWINSLLHTLWPIINPTIFVSFSDLFEDALHRSLPKFIHGVRVADIGQGSEPMRILGIQWLHPSSSSTSLQQGSNDFFNVEVALAYRARKIDKKLRDKAENAHIFLEFLLPGGILFPVFIELTGLLSTARLRIQLTPNPPFFSLTTLTLLGQPKIDFVCTPLSRSFFPNLMDIPGLSGWLKREIENVVSEYVAPRSLTLDLGAMVGGKGERRDTDSEGVIVVVVRRAKGFRCGDAGHVWQSKEKRMGDFWVGEVGEGALVD